LRLLLIDAQHIAEIGRAMTEDREVLANALLEQSQDQGFRQGAFGKLRHPFCESCLDAARSGDGASARAHVRKRVGFLGVKHHAAFMKPPR